MERFRIILCSLSIFIVISLFSASAVANAIVEPIDPWSLSTTLPYKIANHFSISAFGKIYTVAGSALTYNSHDDIIYSTPRSGILDPWQYLLNKYPQKTLWTANASNENYLYGLGGYEEYSSTSHFSNSAVNFASSNLIWSTTTSLPQRLSKGAAAISGNYIYFSGGWTDGETAALASKKVYFTQINSDGTLGSWNTTTDLPDVLWNHGMIEYGGYLYVIGGMNSLGETAQVIRAKVNTDGTLGSWTNMSNLPAVTRAGGYVGVDNYVFVVGGYNGSNFLRSVYYTTIDSSGQMAPWQASTNILPVNHANGSLVSLDGYLYLIGGYISGSGYTDLVFKTKLNITPSKPIVIFLPGMGASWNYEALVHGQNVPNSQWKIPGFIKNYNSLISTLGNADLRVYAYDWRKPITDNANALYDYAKSFGSKVNLIGHSMGGLIAQKMTSLHPEIIDKVITLGSPYQGALSTYKIWEGADFSDFPITLSLAAKLYLRANRNKYDNEVSIIQNTIPSFANVLPTFDYLKSASGKPNNTFFPLADISNLSIIQGSGFDTPRYYLVKPASTFDTLVKKWKYGKPISTEFANGDNTVLQTAATTVASTHSEIANSTQAQEKILETLGVTGATSSVVLPAYEKGVVVSVASPVSFNLITPNETVSPQDGIILLDNPNNGAYTVRVTPIGPGGSYTVYFGRIKNSNIVWDEVSGNITSGSNDHVFNVDFSNSNLGSNPIQSAQKRALEVINTIKGLSVSSVTKSLWLQEATRIYSGIGDLTKSANKSIYENRIIALFKQIDILNGKIKNNTIVEKYRLVKADLEQDWSGR